MYIQRVLFIFVRSLSFSFQNLVYFLKALTNLRKKNRNRIENKKYFLIPYKNIFKFEK